MALWRGSKCDPAVTELFFQSRSPAKGEAGRQIGVGHSTQESMRRRLRGTFRLGKCALRFTDEAPMLSYLLCCVKTSPTFFRSLSLAPTRGFPRQRDKVPVTNISAAR